MDFIKLKLNEQTIEVLARMMRAMNGYSYGYKMEDLKDVNFIERDGKFQTRGIRDHENTHGLVIFDLLDSRGFHRSFNLKDPDNDFTEISLPVDTAKAYGFIKIDGEWQCGDVVDIFINDRVLRGYEVAHIANEGPLRYSVSNDHDGWYVAESPEVHSGYYIIGYTKAINDSAISEDLENKSKVIKTVTIVNDDLSIEIDKEFVIAEFSTLVTSRGSVVEDVFTTVLKFNEENSAELIRLIRKEKEKRALCK